MYKMAKQRITENHYTFGIPGPSSWQKAKKSIWNYFYNMKEDGKFVMECENTYNYPGFYSVVTKSNELKKRLDFVENNHVHEKKPFKFSFHNLYFKEIESEKEVNEQSNKLEGALIN